MSARTSSSLVRFLLPAAAMAAAIAAAWPAAAGDAMFDPLRPNEGQSATAPRQAEREMRRDLEMKSPTLTQRFGLPPVSGPLPPLLPPSSQQPVLLDPGPSPTLPPPQRARQTRERDS